MPNHKILTLDNLSLQEMDHEADLIPLMTPEDEEEMNNEALPADLPILPLRNTVLFPGVVIPITAGRDKSIKLLNDANAGSKVIGVVAQKDETVEDPKNNEIHHIGTVARIMRVLKMPDGNITVILQGKKRFEIDEFTQEDPYFKATIKSYEEVRPEKKDSEFETIVESIKEMSLQIIKESPNIPTEASFAIKNIESSAFLINFVSSNMNLNVEEKQQLLSIVDLKERALETLRYMNLELQKLELRNDIQSKVRFDLDQQQREYFLQQQMKQIQEELGGVSHEAEIEEMRKKAKSKKWDAKTAEHYDKEISKLQRTNPNSPDFGIQRNYLELFLELPWNEFSKDNFDLKRAKQILDRDHFGLEDVKKRIIEHLAVLKLRNDMKSPILCLYGPPGVGKTSIGKSIAEALGREYVRISLGGLRDEAEIRGHRKTYIGAMPGRIIQSIKKAKTSNPVFVLDEIDKLSVSHNGDPSSALLEVLDPEQNNDFHDNFLELGYDLSKVMFIATSNSLSTIQPALRDRMEIINMTGYTIEEKIEIAKNYLVPKQLKEHGLTNKDLQIGKKQLEKIVVGYTRESGVRGLDKKIAEMVRHAAKSVAMDEPYNVKVTDADILEVLKAPRMERDKYENNDTAGVVTGLAWTSVGGDILFIESLISKGKGGMTMTGNLGTVMKESVTIALEYIKANATSLGIDSEVLSNYNIHIHVPEGATPKDGPSAGIAMLTSMVSSFTQKRVKKSIAMTGEITLRGKVLPVGGIKEKILAAKRANIKEIILCKENKRDIEEINPNYIEGLTFHYVDSMKEVIDIAITNQKVKNPVLFEVKKESK
ncbi:S16 family, ATP-dependent endopeptidase La [Flavobacterium indicum GPTSA100-9 = DSM 17447]|uniref:Lon protease n=1 Tax=Flavobacterium indicum (strain DSM 17447 / CIP 109464 / GPTSA100-9) TaxID=1094466 RepID=H8XV53_FLAIG|nr:endopeptidase La [Flavobacterium indicum]CCG53023.1 S16 family, ATP-dependent endopeptidase La [Flavobacterium indicum GPTSA100-9 = DSM 17447]